MKTYIIQLEAHDDLVSASDKLAWAKARRVIFIWPKRGKILGEYHALLLLKREAERQGIDISLISRDGKVLENASDLGIPVFASVSQAERRPWTRNPRRKIARLPLIGYDGLAAQRDQIHPYVASKQKMPAGKIFLFLISLLAVFGLGAFFYPSAEVKIFPERNQQTVNLAIRVDPAIQEVNLAGILPGKLTEIELSGSRTGASSGSMKVGAAKARGALMVTNNSDARIIIPQGTRFTSTTSGGKIFLSSAEVTIEPKGSESSEVPVEAESAGEEWNLPAGTRFSVQTSWTGSVDIANAEMISGGASVDSPTPTEGDYQSLRTLLLSDLKNQAVSTISQQIPAGDILITESLDRSQVLTETRSIAPGTPSDRFTLEVKVLYTVTSYSQSGLTYLAGSILDANLDPGSKAVVGSLKLDDTSIISVDPSGIYGWKVKASRQVEPQFSSDVLVESIAGAPVNDVENILSRETSLRAPSEVVLHPGWWIRMPFVSFRIAIEEQ